MGPKCVSIKFRWNIADTHHDIGPVAGGTKIRLNQVQVEYVQRKTQCQLQ